MQDARLNPLKLAPVLVIDYFRWSQLTPMIAFWGFSLLMLAAMFFVNNQQATWDALGTVFTYLAGLPLIGDGFVRWLESLAGRDGSLELDGEQFKATALKAWGLLSLVFMALAWIAGWLFGPFRPWTLRRKLGVTGLACLVLLAAFVAVFLQDRQQFNGPALEWMLMFASVGVLLAVVSAWCLTVAHLLGRAAWAIEQSKLGERRAENGLL